MATCQMLPAARAACNHQGIAMQVVPLASRQLTQLQNQIREGVIKAYRLIEGEPGPDNFSLKLVNIAGKYFSPRHRHNFDQVRYQLAGRFDYAADGALEPGCLGYFPEGTRYGPQTSEGDTWNLLLQFGGASGSGYTSEAEEDRAAGELKRTGTFEGGVYTTFKADGTKVNKDAYEAIWEHIHKRPLAYPKERYERPVLMRAANFEWLPDAAQPGVASKQLGVFSERQTKIALHRVDAQSNLALQPGSFYFALSGAGSCEAQPYAKHTTIRTEVYEHVRITASEPSEFLQLRVPRYADHKGMQ